VVNAFDLAVMENGSRGLSADLSRNSTDISFALERGGEEVLGCGGKEGQVFSKCRRKPLRVWRRTI
jgi:hypothetical protein